MSSVRRRPPSLPRLLVALAPCCAAWTACGARTGLLGPHDGGARDAPVVIPDGARPDRSIVLPDFSVIHDFAPTPDFAPAPDAALPDAALPDAAPPPDALSVDALPAVTAMYAHTATQLYRVNPTTLQLSVVGTFAWPADVGDQSMTDVAISSSGVLVGISSTRLVVIDPQSAKVTVLSQLSGAGFNALAFVPGSGVPEVLVAANSTGDLYALSITGNATLIGNFGGGFGASGDLVYVPGLGTVATAHKGGGGADWLILVDTLSGQSKPIGQTGFGGVWGLSYWAGKLYGFTSGGQVLQIDTNTGKGTIVASAAGTSFWGAAVVLTP